MGNGRVSLLLLSPLVYKAYSAFSHEQVTKARHNMFCGTILQSLRLASANLYSPTSKEQTLDAIFIFVSVLDVFAEARCPHATKLLTVLSSTTSL